MKFAFVDFVSLCFDEIHCPNGFWRKSLALCVQFLFVLMTWYSSIERSFPHRDDILQIIAFVGCLELFIILAVLFSHVNMNPILLVGSKFQKSGRLVSTESHTARFRWWTWTHIICHLLDDKQFC